MAIDKRSRNRLIIVTAVLAIVVAFLIYQSSPGSYSYYKTVRQLKNDQSLIGVSVRVSGIVAKNSLKQDSSGYHFLIVDNKDKASSILVNYNGVMPQTFAEGIQVVAQGTYKSNNQLDASNILTKCPTKYQSQQKAK